MAIITISRGSYSKGKEVAEKVAERLGYTCISRDLLVETSEHFNIPEIKLVRALHDSPSVLERFTYGKERYLAFITSTLFHHAQKDNMVYHGLAGHFILRGIKHMLNVRILADLDDRVRLEMNRENLAYEDALRVIRKDDDERRQWSLKVFGVDTWDASLYDLVIHIGKLSTDDAVDIICRVVQSQRFKATTESQKGVEDLALAARVKAELVNLVPGAGVSAREGTIYVDARATLTQESQITDEIKALVQEIPGVKEVKVHVSPPTMYE
ncbi:MAG: AAA family ATPase [Desulfomonilaceae bacterium]